MNTPEWLKPGIYGVVIGAVAISAIGFSWGGWMTGSGASKMATDLSHKNVIAALVPVCLERSRTDPESLAKLATIQAASTYQRRDALLLTGWATLPGSNAPDRDLAQACVTGLQLAGS